MPRVLITPEKFGADREVVGSALETENIEARPIWKPMHLQPVFKGCRDSGFEGLSVREREKGKRKIKVRAVGGEVAEDLFNRGLCLPSGTAMTENDLNRVIEVILSCRR